MLHLIAKLTINLLQMRLNPNLKCFVNIFINDSLVDSPDGFYDSFKDLECYVRNLISRKCKVIIKVYQRNGYYKEKTIKI